MLIPQLEEVHFLSFLLFPDECINCIVGELLVEANNVYNFTSQKLLVHVWK